MFGKEDAKLSLFEDVMITYTENPKESTQYLVEQVNSAMSQDTRLLHKNNCIYKLNFLS